jgi:hypothetical protein
MKNDLLVRVNGIPPRFKEHEDLMPEQEAIS